MSHTTLVVDECPMVRRGISQFFEAAEEFRVISEAGDAKVALSLAQNLLPDVVIIEPNFTVYSRNNSRLPEIELCRDLKDLPHAPRVMIYTSYDDPVDIAAAVLARADTYVHKSVGEETLTSALQGLLAGGSEWVHGLSEDYTYILTRSALKISRLSQREKDILPLVLRRYSSREIAEELHISTRTVHNHISSLLRKLDCKMRTDLYKAWKA